MTNMHGVNITTHIMMILLFSKKMIVRIKSDSMIIITQSIVKIMNPEIIISYPLSPINSISPTTKHEIINKIDPHVFNTSKKVNITGLKRFLIFLSAFFLYI